MSQEKQLTEKESLDLIAMMINTAKESNHDSGVSVIMWGAIVSVCALEKLAELQFNFKLPVDIYWLTILAIIPQIFLIRKEKKERKVKSYDDIYMDYLWFGFGISIFLLIFISNAVFNVWEPVAAEYSKLSGKRMLSFREFIAPLFLLLYGMPTFVTGAACKFPPMVWGGLLCWACCIITIYTSIKIDLILTAFSAVFAWLIPGILIEREYRKAKRGLAESNV